MDARVADALGQLVYYEDCNGNFALARDIAENNLKGGHPPLETSHMLIDLAIVHILTGDLQRAFDCLREAEPLAMHEDANLRLRLVTYQLLAIYEHFNTFPDGNGAGATEVTARWRGAEDIRALDATWNDLLKQATDPAIQNEAWLVYGFLCNLKPTRYTLESSRYVPPVISKEQMLQAALNAPVRVQQMAAAGKLHTLAAFADWCTADLCRRGGQNEAAGQFLDRAHVTYQQAGDSVGVATCLLTRSDWLSAPFSTPLAWNFAIQDSSSESSSLPVSLESEEFRMPSEKNLADARDLLEQSEKMFLAGAAPRGLAAIELRYGYLAMLEDDHASAANFARKACEHFESCGDWRGYWTARTHEIMSLVGMVRFTEAPNLARGIGEWGAKEGSFSFTLGLGILLNRFARHQLIRRGDYEKALAGYRAAITLFEALGANSNAAQNLVDQAIVYQAVGQRDMAVTFYEEALDSFAEDIQNRPQIADTLRQRLIMLGSNVFQLYLQQTNSDGMERSAKRLSIQIAGLPGGGTGDFGEMLSEKLRALSEMMSGREPGTATELPAGIESWSLRRLAEGNIEMSSVLSPLYRSRKARDAGNNAQADQFLAEAEAALPKVGVGQRCHLEAIVLAEKKRFEEAAEAFRRHMERGGADAGFVGELTKLMGEVGGEHGQAEALLQQRRTHEQAFSMFVRVKDYAAAKRHLEALEQLAGIEWWARDAKPWQILCDIGEMNEGLGELSKSEQLYDRALRSYDRAIQELEARRKELSRDELKTALAADKSAQYLYFLASRVATKQKEYARAFAYAERGKARALLDLMAGGLAVKRAPEEESAAMRSWRQLNAQLTLHRGLLAQERGRAQSDADRAQGLLRQIEEDEAILGSIEADLARSHPNFLQTISAKASTLSLDEVASALPAGALLLEYYFLGDDLLAWAIDRNGLAHAVAFSLDVSSLTRDIVEFHRACEKRTPVETLGQKLAEKLLEPFAKTIHNYSRLVLVPYGVAHMLPFHALPFGGRPLIENHRISYLPSASTLQFLGMDLWQPLLSARMLAVGNPTGDLTYAATEAAYVASLFNQEALIGEAATEDAVRARMANCPFLHFATHGRLSEESPLSSSIILAKGEELTLYELMGMRFEAAMVVLSACETGKGETTGGDDVLGLTRGLLGAGARAAVVSLWPVDDASTSLLMGEFYRNLRSGNPPAVSLATAQNYLRCLSPDDIASELTTLNAEVDKIHPGVRSLRHGKPLGQTGSPSDHRHPHYWAPFVLVGWIEEEKQG